MNSNGQVKNSMLNFPIDFDSQNVLNSRQQTAQSGAPSVQMKWCPGLSSLWYDHFDEIKPYPGLFHHTASSPIQLCGLEQEQPPFTLPDDMM